MNRKSFIAKARSSTKSCESSGTYGIYVGEHRDDTDFFPKDGKTVTLRLLVEGEDPRIMEDVNYGKESFHKYCPNLNKTGIRQWLSHFGCDTWFSGAPPKLRVTLVRRCVFEVSLI